LKNLRILYEDNHLLVVDKPAGIATMGAESGATLHSMAAEYLRHAYNKPGNVFVGIVSRLDAMTSGVIVLARTSKAASRLAPQFSALSLGEKRATKTYLVIVSGQLESRQGVLTDHMLKDDSAQRMRIVPKEAPGARHARLRFHTLAWDDQYSLVAVRLETGRKHQIRLQFADRGHAVLGDRKYGSPVPFSEGIALHSFQLQLSHPTRSERMTWTVAPPKSWRSLLKKLGVSDHLSERIARLDWHISGEGAERAT
jgi:23S rRNA pseudouridine1911/1915/1917 synthase